MHCLYTCLCTHFWARVHTHVYRHARTHVYARVHAHVHAVSLHMPMHRSTRFPWYISLHRATRFPWYISLDRSTRFLWSIFPSQIHKKLHVHVCAHYSRQDFGRLHRHAYAPMMPVCTPAGFTRPNTRAHVHTHMSTHMSAHMSAHMPVHMATHESTCKF